MPHQRSVDLGSRNDARAEGRAKAAHRRERELHSPFEETRICGSHEDEGGNRRSGACAGRARTNEALDDRGLAAGYAAKSQKRSGNQRNSSRAVLIGTPGYELPTGVHYEAGDGDSYDVDIIRMEQVHCESGSVHRIRREKPTVWRFYKRGASWGTYPRDVCVELERIYLALGRRNMPWDRNSSKQGPTAELAPAMDTEVKRIPAVPEGVAVTVGHIRNASLEALVDFERSLAEGSISPEACVVACDLLFSAAETGGAPEQERASRLLRALVARHGFQCTVGHARVAGLIVGSMRLLQAVLMSSPSLSLVGADVYDKKYPKLLIQAPGRKSCIRCLLARGMFLGSNDRPPHSKLLKKVEADAEPLWVERCLDGMMRRCALLPDSIRDRVCEMLGIEDDSDSDG